MPRSVRVRRTNLGVMAVLVTAIHVLFGAKTWMRGTSPRMTD
jgi:hypothetical protein